MLAPSLESNAELVTPEQSLGNGEYVEYRCKSGYSHTKGDLFRACKRGSGSLTGDEPVCEGEQSSYSLHTVLKKNITILYIFPSNSSVINPSIE